MKIRFLIFFLSITFTLSSISIKKITIEGNSFLSDKEILKSLTISQNDSLDYKTIYSQNENISKLYEKKSYYNVFIEYPEVRPLNKDEAEVIFRIHEETKILFNKIVFTGNTYFSDEKLSYLLGVKAQNSVKDIFRIKEDLLNLYLSRGFLFAKISILELSESKVVIKINEGKICRFKKIYFKGNKITTPKTLLKISGINRVKFYSLDNLKKIESNVRKKEYIQDCNLSPISSEELLFHITENKMSYLNGILGYQNKEDKPNITGFLNIKFLNLFGTDRSVNVKWDKVSDTRSSILFRYHDSGIYSIESDVELFRESVDSTYIESSIMIDFYYKSLNYSFGISNKFERIIPGTKKINTIERYSNSKIGLKFLFDNTDYIYNPTKGLQTSILQYLIFSKTENRIYKKQSTEFELDIYNQLYQKFIFAISVNGKSIYGEEIQKYDFFEMGGFSNLRGFFENQFSGKTIGWTNLELRYILASKSRIFSFIDYGFVDYKAPEESFRLTDLIGLGFGLQVETKIGVLNISYALGHQDKVWSSINDGILHFGIITDF